MNSSNTDKVFAGSIPKLYETYLVPLLFGPYAADVVRRLQGRTLSNVLEVAAGTGVVTRAMRSQLPAGVSIVATDLNQAMLDQAASVSANANIEWRQADALQLPFEDGTFDAVVCQFGVMFFPDRVKAHSEAKRVLKPGGLYIFSAWDRLEENEFADFVEQAVATMFPNDPPKFLSRTPYGYYDKSTIEADLTAAGFAGPIDIETVTERSRAESARIPALAFCEGSPLRNEIEARDPARLTEATDAATETIAHRFGRGAVDARIQAHVITVEK